MLSSWLCITKSASGVLAYVLAEGAPVPEYSHLPCGEGLPSIRILEILVAHGWDINARCSNEKPFLWQALADHETDVWALDLGAAVQPVGQRPYTDDELLRHHTDCPPLLEQAVLYGCSTSTIDLLRSKGAPPGRRMLHFAAEQAVWCTDSSVEGRLALVEHLLDKYNLDVNAFDQSPDRECSMGHHWGNTFVLCCSKIWQLRCCRGAAFCRGADPDLSSSRASTWSAVTLAEKLGNEDFLRAIAGCREANVSTNKAKSYLCNK